MRHRDVAARDIGRRRSDVRVVAVRVRVEIKFRASHAINATLSPVTAPITQCLISTQIRVVRAAVPPPGEGRQLLLSDGHAGNYWLFDDIYEGSFNARRPGGYAGREDRFYVFCMDIGKLRGALEHAELPWRDVVGALRH